MRTKSLIGIGIVVACLLVYLVICYQLLNSRIEVNTRGAISNYLSSHLPFSSTYEFIQAVGGDNGVFRVFVKVNDDYYTFSFQINNQIYELVDVSFNVPDYIR